MSRASLEKQGYLQSFPNLIGAVSTLTGSDRDIARSAAKHEDGGDWTEDLKPSDLVLAPAACYPIYPIAAERGLVPDEGYVFDVAADCFRHEPSRHVDRFQTFRMREYVRIGTPEQIQAFREPWVERAKGIADSIGLPYTVDVANDPFFGRVGVMMANQQREDALKFELLVPVRSAESPTACMSFNYHKEHFGEVWGLHNRKPARCCTPAASLSAWTAWPWRCSPPMARRSRTGPHPCARRFRSRPFNQAVLPASTVTVVPVILRAASLIR